MIRTTSQKHLLIGRTVLITGLIFLSVISLCIGVREFSLLGLFSGNAQDSFLAVISRIPRTLSIIITGGCLSMAGLIMQTITNNKFVSPSTAGTMEWCRLGIAAAILFTAGASPAIRVITAFLVSLSGTVLFMVLLQKMKFKNALMAPLAGMMLGNVVSSVTTFFAYRYNIIQNMSSWLQGNFALIVKGNYEILYLGTICLLIAYVYANKFTIAGMGEGFAVSLGLNHKQIVFIGLAIVAFTTSLVVVTIGSIPFIGLIIPNLISMWRGDNLKGSLPDTILAGSVFVLACDLLGRVILSPYEVNVSVIVSILGSALFAGLLFYNRNRT